jgi:hypothetical protein
VQGSCCGSSVPLLLILLEHSPVTPLAKALIRSPSLGSQDGLLFIMRLCSSRHYDTAGGIFCAVSGQTDADAARILRRLSTVLIAEPSFRDLPQGTDHAGASCG